MINIKMELYILLYVFTELGSDADDRQTTQMYSCYSFVIDFVTFGYYIKSHI